MGLACLERTKIEIGKTKVKIRESRGGILNMPVTVM
jgi:hypothetical protein